MFIIIKKSEILEIWEIYVRYVILTNHMVKNPPAQIETQT